VKVFFRESFARDLAAVTNPQLLRRIREAITAVERAKTFHEIPQLKRLETRGKYYRIRIGDYRLGLVFEDGAFTLVRCLNRKELYRFFP
jgi:mRNA interferase RelE/StbE